ncbi:hypothetical protein JK191_13680 [Gluconobacter sphaericus]|uniref:hypothetical protein n=1 Tax=Gluconobacter sphaericus TaxID=574987 RepID=UPI001B8D9395|nr:hypothetical protein [Gluconobacter sphaericus]MBS1098572.1 hypothetical protein [Gluconobacter sphaericus]
MRETANARSASGELEFFPPAVRREILNLESLITYHSNQAIIAPLENDRRVARDVKTSALTRLNEIYERPDVKQVMPTLGAVHAGLAFIMMETRGVA